MLNVTSSELKGYGYGSEPCRVLSTPGEHQNSRVHPFHIVFIDPLPSTFLFCLNGLSFVPWIRSYGTIFIPRSSKIFFWWSSSMFTPKTHRQMVDDCYIVRTCENHHMFMHRNGWRNTSCFTPSTNIFWFVKSLIFLLLKSPHELKYWSIASIFHGWLPRILLVKSIYVEYTGNINLVSQIQFSIVFHGFVKWCGRESPIGRSDLDLLSYPAW